MKAFENSPFVTTLEVQPHVDHSWHLFVIKIKPENLTIDRGQFIEQLNASGVSTSVHYTPLHLHPLYRDRFGYTPQGMPTASKIYEVIISLPLFPGMSEEQFNYVVGHVNRIGEENQK